MSRFTQHENPLGRFLQNGRDFRLHEPVPYEVGEEGSGEWVIAPRWFVTDWATVPRLLLWLIPDHRARRPAAIHDWLYATRGLCGRYTRRECDDIFLEAMQVIGLNPVTRYAMWLGVRLGGWVPWSNYDDTEPRIEPPPGDYELLS